MHFKKSTIMYLLLFVSIGLAGNFVVQYPAGTEIFRVDTAGNTNVTGELNVTGRTNITGHLSAHGGVSVVGAVDLPANSIQDAEIDTVDESTVVVNADWDIGSYKFTAETLESDVATGTAPFTVASLTRVTNLNASYAGEADNLSCTGCINLGQIATNIVSSVDGVTNDGGDIDLVQGSGITITPDDGANTITIAATGSTVDYWVNATGDNMTGTLDMRSVDINLEGGANISAHGISSGITIDSSGNIVFVLA